MAQLTKRQALDVIRRAYGPDVATSLAKHLPDHVDLEDAAHQQLLARLGVTRDRLFNALGGEL